MAQNANENTERGLPIVLSGPSGSGKTTLARALVDAEPQCVFSISATTREQRKGEEEGRDYYFLSRQAFEQDVEAGRFVEHAVVFGRDYYGTPRRPLEEALNGGCDVLMDIDVQGGLQVKESLDDAVLIFVLPPSPAVLEQRLRERGREDEAAIQRRLEEIERELTCVKHYDYLVINEEVETALQELRAIVLAEHCRLGRRRKGSPWKV